MLAQARAQSRALRAGAVGAVATVAAVRHWALAASAMPSRRDGERVLQRLQAIAALRGGALRAELIQVGGGWRAVCWPFASERDATQARQALLDRGLKTQLVEF